MISMLGFMIFMLYFFLRFILYFVFLSSKLVYRIREVFAMEVLAGENSCRKRKESYDCIPAFTILTFSSISIQFSGKPIFLYSWLFCIMLVLAFKISMSSIRSWQKLIKSSSCSRYLKTITTANRSRFPLVY